MPLKGSCVLTANIFSPSSSLSPSPPYFLILTFPKVAIAISYSAKGSTLRGHFFLAFLAGCGGGADRLAEARMFCFDSGILASRPLLSDSITAATEPYAPFPRLLV